MFDPIVFDWWTIQWILVWGFVAWVVGHMKGMW